MLRCNVGDLNIRENPAGDLNIREKPEVRRILANDGEFSARFKIREKDEGSLFKIRENEFRKILENEAGSNDLLESGSELMTPSDISSSSPPSSDIDLKENYKNIFSGKSTKYSV